MRLVPEKAVWSHAREAAVTSSSIDFPFERVWYFRWKTGSEKPIWQPVPRKKGM